jgi:hypothetical protein
MSYSIDLCVLFTTIAMCLTCLAYRMDQNKDYAVSGYPSIYIILIFSVIPQPTFTGYMSRLYWSSFPDKYFGIFKVFKQRYSLVDT